jgi:hypothetical protein
MRKFLASWRARAITLSVVGLVSAFALTSCSPPPITTSLRIGINEHNPAGPGDNHLHVVANVTVDSCGNVTGGTVTQTVSPYGFLNTFGTVDQVIPVGGSVTSGSNWGPCIRGWVNSSQYVIQTYWDVRLGYTVGGVGIAGDKGICSAVWPLIITSGGGSVDSQVVVNLAKVQTQCHNGFFLSYST